MSDLDLAQLSPGTKSDRGSNSDLDLEIQLGTSPDPGLSWISRSRSELARSRSELVSNLDLRSRSELVSKLDLRSRSDFGVKSGSQIQGRAELIFGARSRSNSEYKSGSQIQV